MPSIGKCGKYENIKELTYIILQLIPVGKVTTYKALAKVFNTSPRVIGRIMKENKDLIVIPCHRVIKSNGDLGGYSLGVHFKRKLLSLEGVKFRNSKVYKECIIHDLIEFIDP